MKIENLRVTNEQQKVDLFEYQIQMKNIMNGKNFRMIMFLLVFVV